MSPSLPGVCANCRTTIREPFARRVAECTENEVGNFTYLLRRTARRNRHRHRLYLTCMCMNLQIVQNCFFPDDPRPVVQLAVSAKQWNLLIEDLLLMPRFADWVCASLVSRRILTYRGCIAYVRKRNSQTRNTTKINALPALSLNTLISKQNRNLQSRLLVLLAVQILFCRLIRVLFAMWLKWKRKLLSLQYVIVVV